MTKDLTKGNVWKVILSFSIPLLISSLVQQFYNMADSAIVGNLDTAGGLAAIGAAYPIVHFVTGIGTGSGMGCTVVISRLFGERRMKDLRSAVYTGMISFSILGIIIAAVGAVLAGTFMRWLGVNDEVFDGARAYLSIYCLGAFPTLLYNAVSAAFTGMGDSRRPLYFLMGSSILNIILDIIAVGPMHLGVRGAAWATVISQIAVAVAALFMIMKKMKEIGTEEKSSVFDVRQFADIVKVAVPCILQQVSVSIGHLFLQGIVNTFGTAVMAGYEIGGKIVNFIYGCFNAMATGLMSFAGQNIGAGEIRRCREGFKATAIMCLIFSVIIAIVGFIFADQIIGLFVNNDEANINEVIRVGALYLMIVLPDEIFVSVILACGGLMRGVGSINYFVAATISDLGTRVIFSFIFTKLFNSYTGIYWAWYMGMAVDMIMCIIWYVKNTRHGRLAEAE